MSEQMDALIRRAAGYGSTPVAMPETGSREAIAASLGIPAGLADRLNGATEQEWREDAKALAEALKANGTEFVAPSAHVSLDDGVRPLVPAPRDTSSLMDDLIRGRSIEAQTRRSSSD